MAGLGAPAGFKVAHDHTEEPVTGPDGGQLVEWATTWELTWDPVPGAKSYSLRYGTSEGRASGAADTSVDAPIHRIEAAAGTSTPDRLEQDRSAGLLLTSCQLTVSVAAVAADGTAGPASAWFPVGDVPEDGVPVGLPVPGG